MADLFDKATAYVQSSSDPSMDNDTKLNFYKLYKQATVGDCKEERPGVFDVKGRAKWDAWNSGKGMSQAECRQQYVAALNAKIPNWNKN